MRNPICLIRTLIRSVRCRAFVSGCEFVEQNGTPKNVQVLECTTCGKVSIAWSNTQL